MSLSGWMDLWGIRLTKPSVHTAQFARSSLLSYTDWNNSNRTFSDRKLSCIPIMPRLPTWNGPKNRSGNRQDDLTSWNSLIWKSSTTGLAHRNGNSPSLHPCDQRGANADNVVVDVGKTACKTKLLELWQSWLELKNGSKLNSRVQSLADQTEGACWKGHLTARLPISFGDWGWWRVWKRNLAWALSNTRHGQAQNFIISSVLHWCRQMHTKQLTGQNSSS